jgi:hypothetical protein
VWEIRLQGRGIGDCTVRKDYAAAGGDTEPFDFTSDGVTYDSGADYDSGVFYATPVFQSSVSRYSVGVCRQFSLLFEGSSSTTVSGPQVLGVGSGKQLGAFGLFGITWLYTALGLA